MRFPPGTRIGPFEVVSLLGEGGMGEVYRAVDPRLGRDAAIKVLNVRRSTDPESRLRFEQEARAASGLNHPGIVTIYDIGEVESASYIAMEYVDGRTLREALAAGRLSLRKALDIAVQLAEGLAVAHDAGIIHRDLKPENVMLTSDGRVKIVDFGLAKLTRSSTSPGDTTHQLPDLTRSGAIVGTAGYMSPEQTVDEPLTFRSDQFSFGSILYEMLTGARAFQRPNLVETLNGILREEPRPIAEANRAVPPSLRWIVERCLSKEPRSRYSSTLDLARELRTVRDHLGELLSPSAERSGVQRLTARRGPMIATAAAVVAALLAAYLLARPASALLPASFQPLTFQRGWIDAARLAPDGRTVVCAAAWGEAPLALYEIHPGQPESRDLGLRGASLLSISRTGDLAVQLRRHHVLGAAIHAGTMARAPLAGGAPRELLEDVQQADWAPAGDEAAVVRERDGQSVLEFPIGKVLYTTTGWISHPRVSPDGSRVAFLDHPIRGADEGSVVVIDPRGERRTLSTGWGDGQGLAWSPSGREVLFTAGRTDVRALRAVSLSGTERVLLQGTGSLTLHDVSPQGVALITQDSTRTGILGRRAGETRERDLSWFDDSVVADLSADGETVLFSEAGAAVDDRPAVCLRSLAGSPAVRLGDGMARRLSRDGARAMTRTNGTPHQLFLLPTGPGQPETLTRDALDHTGLGDFLPDGRRFVFAANEPGKAGRIWLQDGPEAAPRPLSPEGVSLAGLAVSPDGRFVAGVDGRRITWLFPVDGGEPWRVPGLEPGEIVASFTADGHGVYVHRRGEAPARVDVLDLGTGQRTRWRELMPEDPAGVLYVLSVRIAASGSYAYSYTRMLSDLFLVSGLPVR